MPALKQQLYQLCIQYVKQRIESAKQAIDDAQAAAEDETKSSAGDKYETGREMMQQETDRNRNILNEANKLLIALNRLPTSFESPIVQDGSVVLTDNGNFYLAISAGLITIEGTGYFAISPASPAGVKLKGLKTGDNFNLNNKTYLVQKVF